jgi:hypothetical protein
MGMATSSKLSFMKSSYSNVERLEILHELTGSSTVEPVEGINSAYDMTVVMYSIILHSSYCTSCRLLGSGSVKHSCMNGQAQYTPRLAFIL